MDKQALLALARDLAERAGERVTTIYYTEETRVRKKQDGSPVTQADMAANELIVAGLSEATPDIPVITEESQLAEWQQRRHWSRHWLIDPLDGTREFVERSGEFSVNIALIESGEPVLGVVVAPLFDLTYTALVGGKALRYVGKNASPEQLHVRELSSPVVMITSRRHLAGKEGDFAARLQRRLGEVERQTCGSSLKICRVAEGKADIYPRFGPTCEWDTAAADAVLRAAGGQLVDSEMRPLRYHKQELLNPSFAAINGVDNWPQLTDDWPQE